jgi:WD40 repeat protein
LQSDPSDDKPQPVNQQAKSPVPPKAARTDRYGDPLPEGAVARLGTVRLRQPDSLLITSVAFSPDGKVLASAGKVRTLEGCSCIYFWDAATGKELRRLGGYHMGAERPANLVGALAIPQRGREPRQPAGKSSGQRHEHSHRGLI